VLALGSNVGDRLAHLRKGVDGLSSHVGIDAVSWVYRSRAVGYTHQPDFMNAVLTGTTDLGPRELLATAHDLEAEAGRRRSFAGAPRTLDIDLLFHGTLLLTEPDLVLPHPRWADRSFVLAPLSDVLPGFVDPETGRTVLETWEARRDELPPVERVSSPDGLWSRSS